MNKIPVLLLFSLLIISCGETDRVALEEENARLRTEQEDLIREGEKKDSLVSDLIYTFNEIEDNLKQVRESQIELDISRADEVQNPEEMEARIRDEILMITNLMQENKEKISSLQKRLDKSNIKIGQLDKFLNDLRKDLDEKDQEIRKLSEELTVINTEYLDLFDAYLEQSNELDSTITEMNTAYYSIGSFKELKEQGVVEKEGGVIGLGSVKKLKENFNKGYFEKIDLSLTTQIPLLSESAELVSNHESGTYNIANGEGGMVLKILEPKAFWATSKYLVVMVE